MELKEIAERAWIERQLTELSVVSGRANEPIRELSAHLAGQSRAATMRAFVDELLHRFVYAPSPEEEAYYGVPFEPGSLIDVDDACTFVAALAREAGIPCRILGAHYRYKRYGYWTIFLAYQDEEGRWTGVDPLRQKTDHLIFDLIAWVP